MAKSTVTPQKALLSLTPDVSSALEAAMPGIEVDQMVEDDTQCGGSDWLDSKDASKIVKSASLEAVGGASDRRSLSDLVGEATAYLEDKGWVVQAGQGAEGDVSKSMTKKGLSGRVHIEAQTFRLSSVEDVPILTATVITDCLPNPDYQES